VLSAPDHLATHAGLIGGFGDVTVEPFTRAVIARAWVGEIVVESVTFCDIL
jgi:hypothetical protein